MNDNMQAISRGDIFYADLSPVVGCEQGGTRPVLVLQNDIFDSYQHTLGMTTNGVRVLFFTYFLNILGHTVLFYYKQL